MEVTITICGTTGVGKSALTIQFINREFVAEHDPTIEDSYKRQVLLDERACMLTIVDTSGQEAFSSMTEFLHKGDGFVVVYSITDRFSFEKVNDILDSIRRVKPDAPIIVVGNKADLESERKIPPEEGAELCRRAKVQFIEASAKTKTNVDPAFEIVARAVRAARETNKPHDDHKRGMKCVIL
eukprot:c13435_g1_i1.p1 GENE.c13435_g1_i1~~c13435_g1_i1.p1  ORF type:complete len:183 (-),score=32.75 c13435_g1_i1:4-552(-)